MLNVLVVEDEDSLAQAIKKRLTRAGFGVLGPEESGENGVVGIHYGGPTWESLSGSKVVGAVIDRATPDASAIPWLLLA